VRAHVKVWKHRIHKVY